MCEALTLEGSRCRSAVTRLDGTCWFHEDERRKPEPPEPPKPIEPPGPKVRQPPRLPSDADVIERLRGWAEEFDELDA